MTRFDKFLDQLDLNMNDQLSEPIVYTLESGGKRIRSKMVLASFGAYSDQVEKAFPLAAAIEYFHNFSLIHDDIMDDAPLRRSRPSTYGKFGRDRAILSGDAMLVHCYRILEAYSDRKFYSELMKLFSKVAISICEGQQMDMDFEKMAGVSRSEYMIMIQKKTADLLSGALEMGALVSGASISDRVQWRLLGRDLGLAFQMEDDWLDFYSDNPSMGKQKAGDVIQKKKSILYIVSMEKLENQARMEFNDLYHSDLLAADRVNRVNEFFAQAEIKSAVRDMIEEKRIAIDTTLKSLGENCDISMMTPIIAFLSQRKY